MEMGTKAIVPIEQIYALIKDAFPDGLPLPYVQEIFLLECHVAGTAHADLGPVEQSLKVGDFLVFRREPDNPHDQLAIGIFERAGQKLGYIPRVKNEVLARLMDAGKIVFGKIEHKQRFGDWLKLDIRVYLKDM